jgi:hypothetical protein
MGQDVMPFANSHFECGVSHALYNSSVNGDHIFFRNGITSFHWWRGSSPCPTPLLVFKLTCLWFYAIAFFKWRASLNNRQLAARA